MYDLKIIHIKGHIQKRGKLTTLQLTITLCIIILYSIVIPLGYTLYNLESNEVTRVIPSKIRLPL